MGIFDKRGDTVTAERGPEAPRIEPSEAVITPANVPSLSTVPDAKLPEPEPMGYPLAETWAAQRGLFVTDLKADMETLRAKGVQPLHVEGPKVGRDHKLFVYDFSPAKAKELLG